MSLVVFLQFHLKFLKVQTGFSTSQVVIIGVCWEKEKLADKIIKEKSEIEYKPKKLPNVQSKLTDRNREISSPLLLTSFSYK